jgi:hypothetical protein
MTTNYGTIAGADAYHLAHGNTAWTGSDADKLSALTRASFYVDTLALAQRKNGSVYTRFGGVKATGRDQVLAWPRFGAYDVDGTEIPDDAVPIEAEYAAYEAALRELVQPGYLSPDYVPAQAIRREKVDVLETEYAAAPAGVDNPAKPIAETVRAMLSPLLVAWGANDVGVVVV